MVFLPVENSGGAYEKCKGVKTDTNKDLLREDTILMPVMGSTVSMMRTSHRLSILSRLGSHLFGSFRCLWSVLHSVKPQQNSFGGLFPRLIRMVAYTLFQMNRSEQPHQSLFLWKTNLPSVNISLNNSLVFKSSPLFI